jgi:hypothetical protein
MEVTYSFYLGGKVTDGYQDNDPHSAQCAIDDACKSATFLERERIIGILENSSEQESPSYLFSKIIGDFEFKLPDGNDVVERNVAFTALDAQLFRLIELIKGDI